MNDLQMILGEISALDQLDGPDLYSLEQAMEVKYLPDGHVLIEEGQTGDELFIIMDGEVAISSEEQGGLGFKVDKTIGHGEIIGLVALVDQGKRSATCVAKGPVTAAVMDREGFETLFNAHAEVSFAFQRLVAEQLANDYRRLYQLLHSSLQTA